MRALGVHLCVSLRVLGRKGKSLNKRNNRQRKLSEIRLSLQISARVIGTKKAKRKNDGN